MKRRLLEAHYGAFVAFCIARDLDKAFDIIKTFATKSDDYLFLSGVALVLAKFSEACIQQDSDFLEEVHAYFNEFLRDGGFR